MATVKLSVLVSRQRKTDGKYPIYLAVCHKGSERYISTAVCISSKDNFQDGRVMGEDDEDNMNERLGNILHYANEYLKGQNFDNVSCLQLRKNLQENIQDVLEGIHNRWTISKMFDWRITNLREMGNESYAKVHEDVKKAILGVVVDYPLDELDRGIIRVIHSRMEEKGYTPGGIAMKMAKFKATLHEAEMDGKIHYLVNPFKGYKMNKADVRQMDLSVEEFHKIECHESKSKRICFARDIFLLSFYFYGMNIADMLNISFRNGRLDYVRTKTRNMKTGNKNIMLEIPFRAREVMQRITDGTRIVWPCKAEREDILSYVNRGLRLLRQEAGIESKLSTYSARKTFSQFAYINGVDINTIKYCIGQSFENNMDICNEYRIMQRKSKEAMNRVVGYISVSSDITQNKAS